MKTIAEKIASLLTSIDSSRAKYQADYEAALDCGDNSGLVNGEMEKCLDEIGKSLAEIGNLIRLATARADFDGQNHGE